MIILKRNPLNQIFFDDLWHLKPFLFLKFPYTISLIFPVCSLAHWISLQLYYLVYVRKFNPIGPLFHFRYITLVDSFSAQLAQSFFKLFFQVLFESALNKIFCFIFSTMGIVKIIPILISLIYFFSESLPVIRWYIFHSRFQNKHRFIFCWYSHPLC